MRLAEATSQAGPPRRPTASSTPGSRTVLDICEGPTRKPRHATAFLVGNPKRTPKPKNHTNSTKECSEQFEDTTQQNKGFEANRTGKFTRKFGEIFVAKVLWGTFSVPDLARTPTRKPFPHSTVSWWAFRARRKIFSSPPPPPHRHSPGALPPPAPPPRKPPPHLSSFIKTGPPGHLLGRLLLFPRPRTERKYKISETSAKVFLGVSKGGFFARGGNLNNWGGCAHQLQ